MKTIKLVLLAGAFGSIAAVAWAQDNAPGAADDDAMQKPRMSRLDTNKDGSIDKDEFAAAQRLKEADTNGDGTLSTEELTAMVQKQELQRKVDRLTRRLDIDGDGKVTLAEVEQQKAKRFALLDRNNDGKLEAKELKGKEGGHGKRGKHHGKRMHDDQ